MREEGAAHPRGKVTRDTNQEETERENLEHRDGNDTSGELNRDSGELEKLDFLPEAVDGFHALKAQGMDLSICVRLAVIVKSTFSVKVKVTEAIQLKVGRDILWTAGRIDPDRSVIDLDPESGVLEPWRSVNP